MSKLGSDVFSVICAIRSPTVASSGRVIVDAPPGPLIRVRIVALVLLSRGRGLSNFKKFEDVDLKSRRRHVLISEVRNPSTDLSQTSRVVISRKGW